MIWDRNLLQLQNKTLSIKGLIICFFIIIEIRTWCCWFVVFFYCIVVIFVSSRSFFFAKEEFWKQSILSSYITHFQDCNQFHLIITHLKFHNNYSSLVMVFEPEHISYDWWRYFRHNFHLCCNGFKNSNRITWYCI